MALVKKSLKDKLEKIWDVDVAIDADEIKKAREIVKDLGGDDDFYGVFFEEDADNEDKNVEMLEKLDLKTPRNSAECASLIAVAIRDYIALVHIEQTEPSDPTTAGTATGNPPPDATAAEVSVIAIPMADILGLDGLIDKVRVAAKTSIDAKAKPWSAFVTAYNNLLKAHVAWASSTPSAIDPAVPGSVTLGTSADIASAWDKGSAEGSAASAQKFADEIDRSTKEATWSGNLVNPPGLTASALYIATITKANFK